MHSYAKEDQRILNSLTDQVRRAVLKRGILPFTEIQRKGIPAVLSGTSVLMLSPTGTGKTEAAMIPIFHFLKMRGRPRQEGFRVLYITPLRALNRDLLERLTWWSTDLDFSLGVRHGDTLKIERAHQSLSPPDILVTTPETFQIILVGKRLSNHLRSVRWIVVDEIHELAEDKRGTQLIAGLEKLRELAGTDVQLIGLSATIGDPELLGRFMVGKTRSFMVVEASPEKSMEIELALPEPTEEDFSLSEQTAEHPSVLARLKLMDELIRKHGSTLLFTNTRATAESLSNKFLIYRKKLPIAIHHGSLGTSTRIMAEKGLKGGTYKGVVTTSSLELGIDVGLIDFVIQYGSPRQATHLIQRIGRSGHRIGEISKGIIIAMDEEDLIESAVLRHRALQKKLESIEIPLKPLDVLSHQVAGLLMKRAHWHIEEILDLLKRSYAYSDLTIEEASKVMEFMQTKYPSILSYDPKSGIIRRSGSASSLYSFYFEHLSTIPEVKQYPVVDMNSSDIIGILDEEFVAEKGLPGTKFIMAGRVWGIESIESGKVLVKRLDDPSGAVPFWQGEEIPVKFEAAREVGRFRRIIWEALDRGISIDEIAMEISNLYGIEPSIAMKSIQPIVISYQKGYPIATDLQVVIELWGDKLIFHACNGDQVNSALAKILGSLLSDVEHVIATSRDPYRVIIDAPEDPEKIWGALLSLDDKRIDELLISGVESIGLFKRRLVHVSRRFGVISRDADLTSVDVDKLTLELRGSPVFEEAEKELMQKDYDSLNLRRFIQEAKQGIITFSFIKGRLDPSPFAEYALRNIGRKVDLFPPEKVDKILMKYAMARLRSNQLHLICVENLHYLSSLRASDLQFPLKCKYCGSNYVGIIPDEDSARMLKFRPSSKRSKVLLQYAKRTSLLLYRYGELAALALSSKLLKLKDVEQVLATCSTEEELVRSIVMLERSRSFWRSG